MLVVECHLPVHPVADGLNAAPAGRGLAEEFEGDCGKVIDLAVAAVEKKLKHVIGEIRDGDFALDELSRDLLLDHDHAAVIASLDQPSRREERTMIQSVKATPPCCL